MGDAPAAQVAGHVLEHPVERAVLEDLGLAGPRLLARGPDRDLDHVLVHVDPRDVLVHHSHKQPPPEAASAKRTGTSAPPARAPDQYRRLTHAHAAATGVTRQGAPAPT